MRRDTGVDGIGREAGGQRPASRSGTVRPGDEAGPDAFRDAVHILGNRSRAARRLVELKQENLAPTSVRAKSLHRYAMILHTDEPHPHVHMVMKAMSEQGVRLNIRKATLREWRREFARHLRAHGVEANATERAVGGSRTAAKLDGIYRSERRGESHHTRTRIQAVAQEPRRGGFPNRARQGTTS